MTDPCTRCDTPHDPNRCQGHVIKDPETRQPIPPRQCGKTPVKGSTVCRSHGAAKGTPAAAKAEERIAEQAADAKIRKLWVGLGAADPVTDPVASMARLAGALEQFLDTVGEKVNELQHYAAGESLSQVRGELVLWERTAAMLGRLLQAMAALGIAERQVVFEQRQAEAIMAAFWGALGLVSVLVPADRDLLLREFLKRLGVGVEPLGEIA